MSGGSIKERKQFIELGGLETEINTPWEQGGATARPVPEEQRCCSTRQYFSLNSKNSIKERKQLNELEGLKTVINTPWEQGGATAQPAPEEQSYSLDWNSSIKERKQLNELEGLKTVINTPWEQGGATAHPTPEEQSYSLDWKSSIKERKQLNELEGLKTVINTPWEQGGATAHPAREEQSYSLDWKSRNKPSDHVDEGSEAPCIQETPPRVPLTNDGNICLFQELIDYEPWWANYDEDLPSIKHENHTREFLFDDNIEVDAQPLIFTKTVAEEIFKERKDVNLDCFILKQNGYLRDSNDDELKELSLNFDNEFNIIFISKEENQDENQDDQDDQDENQDDNIIFISKEENQDENQDDQDENQDENQDVNHMMLLYTMNSDRTAGIIETDQKKNSASAKSILKIIKFPDGFTIIPGGIKNRAAFGFQNQLDSCWVWVMKFAEYIVFGQRSQEEAPSERYEKIFEDARKKKAIQCTEL